MKTVGIIATVLLVLLILYIAYVELIKGKLTTSSVTQPNLIQTYTPQSSTAPHVNTSIFTNGSYTPVGTTVTPLSFP